LLVIVSGPGGVGKGTVINRVRQLDPEIELSRSWTTRPRRPDDREDAYVFVDRAAFQRRIAEGGFLEWTTYPGTGHLYGTPRLEEDSDRVVLLEIELNGALQVKALYPETPLIFIVAPSLKEQEERLRGRGDDDASVMRRLDVGARERRLGEEIADHVVVNDDLERAAREVAGILAAHKAGR
jgi:guanylate kinase